MRPVRDDMDRGGAPVSAQAPEHSFWDHLGATRADEYAQEDILDICPEPAIVQSPVPPTTSHDAASLDLAGLGAATAQAYRPADAAAAGNGPQTMGSAPGAGFSDSAADWQSLRPVPPRTLRRAVSAAQTRRARWSYRFQRIWLTPFYRGLIARGLPTVVVLGLCAMFLANAQNRAQIVAWAETVYSAVVDRSEFMVTQVEISPVAPELERSLRARISAELPRSSFRLDLPALRAEIESYDSVAEAALRLGADGRMIVTLKERVPVVLWHSGTERQLLDIDGHRVAILSDAGPVPDLPLIAGEGAQAHIREALALLDAALPLGARLRGLVRVGARRWDVVLDRDQRIRLPEQGAMQALERVLALDDAQDLLARDVLAVDLRNPTRPVLHVSPGAIETLRAIRTNSLEASQ